jgi:hypothetical protein
VYLATSYVVRHYSHPDGSILQSRFWDGFLFWAFILSIFMLPVVVALNEVLWTVFGARVRPTRSGLPIS